MRGYEQVQRSRPLGVGDLGVGDRRLPVALGNAALCANDRCVIDGRTTTIQACDTRRLRNEIVLHLIQVRG